MCRRGKTNLKSMDKTMQNAQYIGSIKIDLRHPPPPKKSEQQQH